MVSSWNFYLSKSTASAGYKSDYTCYSYLRTFSLSYRGHLAYPSLLRLPLTTLIDYIIEIPKITLIDEIKRAL